MKIHWLPSTQAVRHYDKHLASRTGIWQLCKRNKGAAVCFLKISVKGLKSKKPH